MTIIGVTGSRTGPVPGPQATLLASLLRHPATVEVHHGDCVGVDAFTHRVAAEAGKTIIVHPPLDSRWRAWCILTGVARAGVIGIPKEYLTRNHDIVDACDRLLAVPAQLEEVLRSGTWATVRYAVKVGKPVTIVWPDGRQEKR